MLKRFLVLAVFLVLFVMAFFIHQWWTDAAIEGRFRAERDKYHVEGQELVTANPPTSEPMTPTAPPMPVVATGGSDAALTAPASTPTPAGPASPAEVPLDSNTLIGPMPPASPTPDANPGDTTAPAAPATNASPDSTLLYPGLRRLPLFLLGSYNLPHPKVQETGAAPEVPVAPAGPSIAPPPPASNAPPGNPGALANAPKALPLEVIGTNAEPVRTAPLVESRADHPAVSAIVLLYHQFTPPGVRAGPKFMWTMPQDVFAFEMKYLHDNHFNVVPLADVIAFAKGKKQLPPNAVAITFDDGYKSPLVFAYPILKSYNYPWTFFIYPAFIGNHPSTNYRGAASWPELVELQKEGVDIECHSMTHPNLKSTLQIWPPDSKHAHRLSPEEYNAFLTNEVVNSKQILEKQLGKTITCFAYPFGEYNLEVQSKILAAGYEAIFTVAGNPIHPGSPLKSMGRYTLTTPVEKMFTAWLNQRSLILADIVPEPGATTTDSRPVISAVLRYAGSIKAGSINAEVSNMGEVKTDFDPKTSMLRLYLPRDLVAQTVLVDVHAKDAETGHTLAASWRFDYQATASGVVHKPISDTVKKTSAEAMPVPAVSNRPLAIEPVRAPANASADPSAEATQSLATPPPGTVAPAARSNVTPAIPAVPAGETPVAPTNSAPR